MPVFSRRRSFAYSILTLESELTRGLRQVYRTINICFIGCPGTGRTTLAARFRDINGPPYDYFTFIESFAVHEMSIKVENRPNVVNGIYLTLRIYIQPPTYRHELFDPLYVNAQLISLFAFCFDVNEEESFYRVEEYLDFFSESLGENLSNCILVGNKIDSRDIPRRNRVSTKLAKRKAKQWKPLQCYFKCSAWENRGVNRLLDFILNLILGKEKVEFDGNAPYERQDTDDDDDD